VKKFFQDDLWTSYGIRTHSTLEPDFDPLSYHLGSIWPHDNWIIAQGLKKFGYSNEFDKVKNALFKAYEKLGYLPEYYAVVDNKIIAKGLKEKEPDYPQAWSTGALINFLLEK
jgi:glycogen debranching enzyme